MRIHIVDNETVTDGEIWKGKLRVTERIPAWKVGEGKEEG